MKYGLLSIHFEHYWHCGSGQAGEGDVDLVPVTEPCGLPYAPGRSVRGRLKWTAREQGWDEGRIQALFGKGDARDVDEVGNLHLTHAIMRDPFAADCRRYSAAHTQQQPKPEVAALFEDIASTALKDGAAAKSTLRRVHYAVPVTLIAEVKLEKDELWDDLDLLVGALRAIGKGKHDGFGWCRAALKKADAPDNPKKPADAVAYDLDIELLDDVVISATSATAGGHRTLHYVPGSALMGAAARVLFRRARENNDGDQVAAENEGAKVLAQAQISFGNGYPVQASGAATVPVPLAWHHAKGESPADGGTLNALNIHNLAARPYEESGLKEKQPVQMREGWLDAGIGQLVTVDTTHTLKTAISKKLGDYETAAEGELFGYEAIVAGSHLRARIEIRDQALCEVVREAFDGRTIRLGRSKGTEFGRARCTLQPAAATKEDSVTGVVAFLAESDIALVDKYGFPTLCPEPEDFFKNPAGWTLDSKRTYMRTRRFSLWNAKRGSPDLERQVISKGSVIVFTCSASTPSTPKLRVGVGQTEGLGRVIANPKYLRDEAVNFEKGVQIRGPATGPPAEAAASNTDQMTAWVVARHTEKQFDVEAARIARDWSKTWGGARQRVNASQWGRLDEVARNVSTVVELKAKLGDGSEDRDGRKTTFGHGKWRKCDKLVQAVLAGLNQTPPHGDRLALAAFREGTHRMAAQTRRERQ